jgi:hypothetical protein
MAIDQGVLDSVAGSNFKTLADGPAFFMNSLIADSLTNQRNVNSIREASLSAALHKFASVDIGEAIAENKIATGNDLAQQLAAMGNMVAALQQSMKGAQTTIPTTAVTV